MNTITYITDINENIIQEIKTQEVKQNNMIKIKKKNTGYKQTNT